MGHKAVMRKLVTVMEERRSIQRYSSEGGLSQHRGMSRDGDGWMFTNLLL